MFRGKVKKCYEFVMMIFGPAVRSKDSMFENKSAVECCDDDVRGCEKQIHRFGNGSGVNNESVVGSRGYDVRNVLSRIVTWMAVECNRNCGGCKVKLREG